MRSAPAEQRRAIYDRARQALLGQLRSMRPPVPEESINRESLALDEAIARVEADLVVPADTPSAAAAPDPVAPDVTTPPATPEPPPAAPAPAAVAPSAAATPSTSPPPVVPAAPAAPEPPPVVAPPPVAMPPRVAPARPAAEALSRIVAERDPPVPVIRPVRLADDAADKGDPAQRVVFPSAPRLEVPSFADALAAAGGSATADPATVAAAVADGNGPSGAVASRARDDLANRPLAPRPSARERFNGRALILIAVAVLVVAGIAYAAWRLRDRPEALARAQAALQAAQQARDATAAKVVTRADGGGDSAGEGVVVPTTPPSAATPPPGGSAIAVVAAPPPPIVAQQESASVPAAIPAAPAATTGAAPVAAPLGVTSSIAVAQQAALLVDAPEEQAKVKTFVGTVVWTTANASPGPDQPISRTIHADVDVPDVGLKLAMVLQKNEEAQFPASHTLELHFSQGADSTLGPVKQINVPQMRQDESPAGDPLTGLPVTITDNHFLIGLTRGDAVARNLDLIKSRNWFDIPLLLTSGKIAKITFEKGTSGQKVIDEVLQSWQ